MKRRLILIVLSMIVAVIFCSCGTNSGQSDGENESIVSETPAPTSVKITMIDTVGKTIDVALAELNRAGFSYVQIDGENIEESEHDKYVVVSQSPSVGDKITKDSKVTITCERIKHSLYIDINFDENLFLARKDVELSIDGELIDTIEHGKYYTRQIEIEDGNHKVRFKADDGSSYADEELNVCDDMTFKCRLHTNKNSINVTEIEIIHELVGTSVEMIEVTGSVLDKAKLALSNVGFVNVTYVTSNNDSVWNESNWTVINQNIKAGEKIDKNEKIELVCEKTANYIARELSGISISALREKINELGYTATYIDGSSYEDITSRIISMREEEVNKRRFTQVEVTSSENYTVKIYLSFDEAVQIPDVTGETVLDAFTKLNGEGLTKIKLTTENGGSISGNISNKQEWIVVSQSPSGGSAAKVNAEITLACRRKTGNRPQVTPKPQNPKYNLDKDLIVVMCKKDEKYTTMYNIAFAEYDSDGTLIRIYAFDNCINPRSMGEEFNVIGELPTWFAVGETVHVRAKVRETEIIGECKVTKPLEVVGTQTSSEKAVPLMTGIYVDAVIAESTRLGVDNMPFGDEDFGHGTRQCTLCNSDNRINIDIIYWEKTSEIIAVRIIAYGNDSVKKDYIISMSKIACSKSDSDTIGEWVESNIGEEVSKKLNGTVYELSAGSNNIIYSAGIRNWEEWELSFN